MMTNSEEKKIFTIDKRASISCAAKNGFPYKRPQLIGTEKFDIISQHFEKQENLIVVSFIPKLSDNGQEIICRVDDEEVKMNIKVMHPILKLKTLSKIKETVKINPTANPTSVPFITKQSLNTSTLLIILTIISFIILVVGTVLIKIVCIVWVKWKTSKSVSEEIAEKDLEENSFKPSRNEIPIIENESTTPINQIENFLYIHNVSSSLPAPDIQSSEEINFNSSMKELSIDSNETTTDNVKIEDFFYIDKTRRSLSTCSNQSITIIDFDKLQVDDDYSKYL